VKRHFVLILGIVAYVCLLSCHAVFASEKTVQMIISGCSAWGAQTRIGAILKKIGGVVKFHSPKPNVTNITFDDEKTNLGNIMEALAKGGFPVQGKPVYLK